MFYEIKYQQKFCGQLKINIRTFNQFFLKWVTFMLYVMNLFYCLTCGGVTKLYATKLSKACRIQINGVEFFFFKVEIEDCKSCGQLEN